MLALEIEPRGKDESTETIRARGFVPAVFYGPKEASTPIAINARTLKQVWQEAGQTSVVTLKGAGGDKDTLIYDVQVHPVTGTLLHADFYVLEKGKKIEIAVPLEFTGESPAEKAGHIIVKILHEIEIEVAPADLPHNLPVDISILQNVGDHILASQIPIPPSATLITDGNEIVASVTAFIEEKIEAAAPAPVEVAALVGEKPAEESVEEKQKPKE